MSRLTPLPDDRLDPETAAAVRDVEARGGDATLLRVLAHRPDLFRRYFAFYYPGHEGGVVESSLKELVRLRIARLNDCFT